MSQARFTTTDVEERSTPETSSTHRLFSASMLVSGIRCALTYVAFPFVTPMLGLAPGLGPALGIGVGATAIVANLYSIRRFWKADHRLKKPVTGIHLAVIALMVVLIVLDVGQLTG